MPARRAFTPARSHGWFGPAYLCLRGGTPKDEPLETIVAAAHPFAEDVLDIVSVEERLALLVSEPHDPLVWRRGAHGLKVQLTTSITFAAEPIAMRATVRNAQGNIVPDPPYVPPSAPRRVSLLQVIASGVERLRCISKHVPGSRISFGPHRQQAAGRGRNRLVGAGPSSG